MNFSNIDIMLLRLKDLKEIGLGSQGICYLNESTNEVYKIFHQAFDNDTEYKITYSKNDLMKFSHIINKTFIWSKDIISINDDIVGYINNFVKSKPLHKIDPLKINLDKFIKSIELAKRDINIISQNGVLTYDLMYNILYGNRFYVTDFDEFSYTDKDPKILEEKNNKNFNYELYYFLIDSYFDDFINEYRVLNKMYKDQEDIISFIELLKKYLSEYVGYEIKKLNDASICLNKRKNKEYSYQRLLK